MKRAFTVQSEGKNKHNRGEATSLELPPVSTNISASCGKGYTTRPASIMNIEVYHILTFLLCALMHVAVYYNLRKNSGYYSKWTNYTGVLQDGDDTTKYK